jgi:putative Holliday junction resolvase
MFCDPPETGRLLGVDYGAKRIGLAITDPDRLLATPWGVVERKDDRSAAREIARICDREEVVGLVVGEPRRLDGGRGDAASKARRFAERLARTAELPVTLVDEALTSVEAERRLERSGGLPDPASGQVDAVAAQILLEEVLERSPRRPPSPWP